MRPHPLSTLFLFLSLGFTAPQAFADVPAGRLERLTRGINLSHWLSQIPTEDGAYRREWFDAYIGREDFALLAGGGFRHVRLPVEFELFLDEQQPGALKPEFLPVLDNALDALREAGLAVIVDWHAREDTKRRLKDDPAFADTAATLWGALARHLATRDPEWVFLETLNEPAGGMTAAYWSELQQRFVAAIRAAAPAHTIIVTAHLWSSIDELLQLPRLAEDNLVYNFHFYEPMVFTHQSAHWPEMGLEPIAGLAYPAEAASKEENLARIGDFGRQFLLAYDADRDWLARRLAIIADWGRRLGVPVTCNEFGVYTHVTPRADRLRWLRDTRELLEEFHIGWTMWDYAGGFAVTSIATPGARQLDSACLEALGLAGNPGWADPDR